MNSHITENIKMREFCFRKTRKNKEADSEWKKYLPEYEEWNKKTDIPDEDLNVDLDEFSVKYFGEFNEYEEGIGEFARLNREEIDAYEKNART